VNTQEVVRVALSEAKDSTKESRSLILKATGLMSGYGEYRNGHPLSYWVDILSVDPRFKSVAIEVEGEGSSSRNNRERDAYLGKLGISVLHVSNKEPSENVITWLKQNFAVDSGKSSREVVE
jgi:very-short-patch-repair endonuclease